MTIVSIYNSRSHTTSEKLLLTLLQQLPKQVKLTANMGSSENDKWGCQVLSFINKNQLNILNDGRHTRTSGTSKSAIHLIIASPSIQPILSWNVTDSPLCSDHCVIAVNIQAQKLRTPNFNHKLQHQ